MKKMTAGVLAGIGMAVLTAVPAHAAPVTVHVRVEGPTSTLVDTDVTTDVRPWHFTAGADTGDHECAGTASTGGSSPVPVPVSNNALLTALEQQGLSVTGSWYSGLGASFSTIGGVSVSESAPPYRYLVEFHNFQPAANGGCAEPIANGDEVLYGFAEYGSKALKLTGPATLAPGATGTVTVTDGTDPVAGASVGGATTGADGTATIGPFTTRGAQAPVKATKDGLVRSNALAVCVTDGGDGFCGTSAPGAPATPAAPCVHDGDDGRCGTTDRKPALGQIGSVREKQRFARGKGPRTLGGTVNADGSGLKDVELRLTRTDGGRCTTYDARRERFVAMKRCGAARGTWFSVGDKATWEYQLPSRLGRGRYVLDVRTTDNAGNVDDTLQRTRNRIVFTVS